jgi:hypothetical protein
MLGIEDSYSVGSDHETATTVVVVVVVVCGRATVSICGRHGGNKRKKITGLRIVWLLS